MKTKLRGTAFPIPLCINDTAVKKIVLSTLQGQGGRSYQEDSFGFSSIKSGDVRKKGFTAVVADGMGGLVNSEAVSEHVVNTAVNVKFEPNSGIPMKTQLENCLFYVNSTLQNFSGGSTAIVVHCCENGVYWCSIGDSRMYLCRKGRLFRVTEDMDYLHTLYDKVLGDELDIEEAMQDERASRLTQHIGMRASISVESSNIPYLPSVGDKLFICTDGVYNALIDEELAYALSLPNVDNAGVIHSSIISKNFNNQDNFTGVILDFQ